MSLAMPPAQPPAEEIAAVQDELRQARRELHEAALTVARVGDSVQEARAQGTVRHPITEAYWRYETEVAELRATRWALHVHKLEQRARALGLEP